MIRIAGCLFLASTVAALAQPVELGKEGELANFLPPEPGRHVCYARTYSADHLKAHPKQKVTEVRFRLAYYFHQPEADLPKGQRNYYFAFQTKLRNKPKPVTALGECVPHGDKISCGVECDGGGILVKRRDNDQILIDFGDDDGRIRMSEGCDEEQTLELTPGADDRSFLLTKTPDTECPAYDDW